MVLMVVLPMKTLQIDLEDKTSGIATYSQAGSTSGTAYVLNGITVAAA
jgi:hypothetical protein